MNPTLTLTYLLVAALLTMGLSTVAIGLLPTHAQIGLWAPALLALCRFGQGLGLGGEWGGAALLAVENAPDGIVVVTEHLRDTANFLAYNMGAFHFHAHGTWLAAFAAAGCGLGLKSNSN